MTQEHEADSPPAAGETQSILLPEWECEIMMPLYMDGLPIDDAIVGVAVDRVGAGDPENSWCIEDVWLSGADTPIYSRAWASTARGREELDGPVMALGEHIVKMLEANEDFVRDVMDAMMSDGLIERPKPGRRGR